MYRKSNRLLKIYSLLKRGPVTIETITQWASKNNLTISKRTFYRDMLSLENALIMDGEKLVVTVGEKNKKIWKIEYDDSSEKLTEFDIQSFLLFKNLMPLPLVKSREITFDRIENLFYKNYSKSKFEDFSLFAERQISNSYFYDLLSLEGYEKILNDAIWSIQNKREMKLIKLGYDYTYVPKSIKLPVTFLPIQLLYHRGVINLCGFLKENGNLFIFGLNQTLHYQLTNDMFDNQPFMKVLEDTMKNRFGITANMNDEVYDIEIEFAEFTGEFLKKHFWHHTQDFVQQENRNYIMKMRCGINRELVGWIFQWMCNAKVMKPDFLTNLVIEQHQEILNSYNSKVPPTPNYSFLPYYLIDNK